MQTQTYLSEEVELVTSLLDHDHLKVASNTMINDNHERTMAA